MDPRAVFFIALATAAVAGIVAGEGSGVVKTLGAVGFALSVAAAVVALELVRWRGGRRHGPFAPWWRGWNDMDRSDDR